MSSHLYPNHLKNGHLGNAKVPGHGVNTANIESVTIAASQELSRCPNAHSSDGLGIDVAVLGARGMIGHQYMTLLTSHPWFKPHPVETCAEAQNYRFVFSALPTEAALILEPQLAAAGCGVISSAAAHRTAPHIPIFIPEVNPHHLEALDFKRGWILTKPNCTVHTFLLPLAPLHNAFQLTHLHVTSLQALSGAGKRGLEDPLLRHHVAAYIADEEEKCTSEPTKILGLYSPSGFVPAPIDIFAQCTRVPVVHGHMVSISARFAHPPSLAQVRTCWEQFQPLPLPSSPSALICYDESPVPILPTQGMTVLCSRLRTTTHYDIHFIALAHNLIRGGAGTGVLAAEFLYKRMLCVTAT